MDDYRSYISVTMHLYDHKLTLRGVQMGKVQQATALGGQDPFTMPMSIVIKDPFHAVA